MNDVVKIYQLYVESADVENEQPQLRVYENGDKLWRLHGKLHREDGPAIEWANGDKEWWLNGKLHRENAPAVEKADGIKMWCLHGALHRENAPAVEYASGSKEWYLHGKLHREEGPAIEYADGDKEWYLHNMHYANVAAWAQAVLKMHNKPHDEEAVQKYVRMILMKDDLI